LNVFTWAIVAASIAGVIFRPFGVKEFWPALAGAAALVCFGLLPPRAALAGVAQGTDVYLFLTGMMILAELAVSEGFFDWLAACTGRLAAGSARKLFFLIYIMAVLVTVFLSNDATAVVFTPAVAAMARTVKAQNPLPYLLICAFVANAASFVLPISNPANLVVYGAHLPALGAWVARYGLASAGAIVATFLVLRFTQRGALRQRIEAGAQKISLSPGGRRAGLAIAAAALVLIAASAAGLSLGAPTFFVAVAGMVFVLAPARQAPWAMLRALSWSVLPLVAGLFVMVAALDRTGVALGLANWLRHAGPASYWGAGIGLALVTNLVNNLPAGLLAGHALAQSPGADAVTRAVLIGVDLGPNLSVTGSLATILWLTALRRAGIAISAWTFLRLGALVMPPALALALAGGLW
jgi:arsenical pump membrane protein